MIQIKESKTELGFRDVTRKLIQGNTNMDKYDVARRIQIKDFREQTDPKNPLVYFFFKREYNMRGRVFPEDEIINLNEEYDIIMQNIKKETGFPNLNVDAQIYHDFSKGEQISARVSRYPFNQDPSFKLFNKISCFIKNWGNHRLYREIRVGTIVLVEVVNLWANEKHIHAITKPLEILTELEEEGN